MRLPLHDGLRVRPDGSWQAGEAPVVHLTTLRWLKGHLRFEDDGAFVVDGDERVPVLVEGPPFEVLSLALDAVTSTARARLDDGSEEELTGDSLGMDDVTGRFECTVRGGRAQARLSRTAHQQLLDNAEEAEGRFFLRVGSRRLGIRT